MIITPIINIRFFPLMFPTVQLLSPLFLSSPLQPFHYDYPIFLKTIQSFHLLDHCDTSLIPSYSTIQQLQYFNFEQFPCYFISIPPLFQLQSPHKYCFRNTLFYRSKFSLILSTLLILLILRLNFFYYLPILILSTFENSFLTIAILS